MFSEVTYIIIDTYSGIKFNTKMIQNQLDGLDTYFRTKIKSNPENTVGVIAMGDNSGFGVLAEPTLHYNKLYLCTQYVRFGGMMQLGQALHLAAVKLIRLDHMKRRVVVFAGRGLTRPKELLKDFGRRYKLKGIAVDVVHFGSEDKDGRLEALVSAANNNDNSHFLQVPTGSSISDILLSNPMFITGVSMKKEEKVAELEMIEDAADEFVNVNESVVEACGGESVVEECGDQYVIEECGDESVNVEEKEKRRRRYRGRDKRPGKGRKGKGGKPK